jgi:uncharacterized protein YlzI (FlbEa/FlbD family)
MSDLMKLTHIHGKAVWINPEMIARVEAHGTGSTIEGDGIEIEVTEDPEKVINERRAAMERQP